MCGLNRYMVLLLAGTIVQSAGWAQTKKTVPSSVTNLFNDLPVPDASASSVLRERESAAEKIANNIFVTTSLNTDHCFAGEPVLFTATLYSALQSNSVIKTAPPLAGFVTTEMPVDNERPRYKKIAGKNYRVFTIRRLQLLPIQEGALTITPLVVNNKVRYTDENDHEQEYAGLVHSEPVTLRVKPLPAKGKPAAFSGLVGKFSMEVTMQRLQVSAGEADTLHLVISGSGNFTDCKLPAIAWPEGVEPFPVNTQLDLEADSFPFTGSKTFDIPFVVSKPGTLLLPAISLVYFNAATAAYKTINSAAITIDVLPAMPDKKTVPVVKASKHKYAWVGYAVLALVWVIAAIVYIRGWNRTKRASKPSTITEDEIVTVDYNAMITGLQDIHSPEQYLVTCKHLLQTFLTNELGLTGNSEEVLVAQLQRQLPRLAGNVQQLYTTCNRLLYSPGGLTEEMKQDLVKQLTKIVLLP